MSSVFVPSLLHPLTLPGVDFTVGWEKVVDRNITESQQTLKTGNQNYFVISRSFIHLSGIDWAKVLQPVNEGIAAKNAQKLNLDFLKAAKVRVEQLKNDIQTAIRSASSADDANKKADDLINAYEADNHNGAEEFRNQVHTLINQQATDAEKTAVTNIWAEGWSYVQSFIGSIGDWLKNIWNQMVDFFKGIWDGLVSAWNAISNAFTSAWDAITSIF